MSASTTARRERIPMEKSSYTAMGLATGFFDLADKYPDRPALDVGDIIYTYRELSEGCPGNCAKNRFRVLWASHRDLCVPKFDGLCLDPREPSCRQGICAAKPEFSSKKNRQHALYGRMRRHRSRE